MKRTIYSLALSRRESDSLAQWLQSRLEELQPEKESIEEEYPKLIQAIQQVLGALPP